MRTKAQIFRAMIENDLAISEFNSPCAESDKLEAEMLALRKEYNDATERDKKLPLKDKLISCNEEMKVLYGDEYPSWQEEAKIRIDQIKKVLRDVYPDQGLIRAFKMELRDLEAALQERS